MNRARVGAVVAAFCLLLAAGCSPDASGPDESTGAEQVGTARISINPGAAAFHRLPLHVADELGLFEEEGVQLQIEQMATSAVPAALVSGSIDYAYLGLSSTIDLIASGQDVVAFAGTHVQNPNMLVVSSEAANDRGITTDSPLADKIDALRGLKIAVTSPDAGLDLTLRYIAHEYGLDPDSDFEVVYLREIGTFLPALQQGAIDGFLSASPIGETAIVNGLAINYINLLSGEIDALDGMLFEAMMGSRATIEENPNLARGVVRAIWRALELIRDDPENTKAAVRDLFDLPDEVFELAWEFNYPSYARTPLMTDDGVQIVLDMGLASHLEYADVDVQQVYTSQYVHDVEDEFK